MEVKSGFLVRQYPLEWDLGLRRPCGNSAFSSVGLAFKSAFPEMTLAVIPFIRSSNRQSATRITGRIWCRDAAEQRLFNWRYPCILEDPNNELSDLSRAFVLRIIITSVLVKK